MKASIRNLALLGLGLTTLAVAAPSPDRHESQRDQRSGRPAAPTPPPPPAPRIEPARPPRNVFQGAPRGVPQGAPPAVPQGVPRGAPQGAPQFAPQQGAHQPGGFGNASPGGRGPANGGGNWRNDNRNDNRADNRNDQRNDNQRSDGWRRDYNNSSDRNGRPGNSWGVDRGRNYYDRGYYDNFRARNFRYDGGRYYARTRFRLGAFYWPRGYGARIWFVGQWLPSAFFYDDYYLYSYNSFGLYPPPYGCRWIRVGDDALLVDEFTGEILDAVYDLFW